MIEVQCTSCHTRYRIEEQVLPEGTPTFKCSRCGHVFAFEPRPASASASTPKPSPARPPRPRAEPSPASLPEAAFNPSPATAPRRSAAADAIANSSTSHPAETRSQSNETETSSEASPASDDPGAANGRSSAGNGGRAIRPKPAEPAGTQARKAEEFFSRLFSEKDEESKPGDNLAFDFHEEPTPELDKPTQQPTAQTQAPEPAPPATWQVGDEPAFNISAPETHLFEREDASSEVTKRGMRRSPRMLDEDEEDEFVDESSAPIYNRAATHSARTFLLMLLLVGLGFGVTTLLVHNAPAAAAEFLSRLPVVGQSFARPTTPAQLVALRDVRSDYLRSKGGHAALVITGTAENVGVNALHAIKIDATLRDSNQRTLAEQSVYCGNNLSARTVSEMTPHEVDFFQKLEPPRTFVLDPSAASPFVLVFVDPPSGVARFDLSVAQALRADRDGSRVPD